MKIFNIPPNRKSACLILLFIIGSFFNKAFGLSANASNCNIVFALGDDTLRPYLYISHEFYFIHSENKTLIDSLYLINYCVDPIEIAETDRGSLYGEDTIYIDNGSECMNELCHKIRMDITSFSPKAKMEFVLQFVQCFKHINDLDVFGEEKVLTPESFLAKQRGDCDDKAVLFAYLVKRILGLDVVWIELVEEMHVNCGVEIEPEPGQEFIVFNEKKYVVAETSGLFYKFGTTFIDMKKAKPKIKPVILR